MAWIIYFYSGPRSKVKSLEALEFWSRVNYSRKILSGLLISIMKKKRYVSFFHVRLDKEIVGITEIQTGVTLDDSQTLGVDHVLSVNAIQYTGANQSFIMNNYFHRRFSHT